MSLVVILCCPSDVPAAPFSRRRWEDFFLPGGQDPSNAIAYWSDVSYRQYDTRALLAFHQALVRGKYRRLFSSSPCPKKAGPKGPSEALIQAIVELKSRNPRFGCPRIACIISQTFGVDIDKNVVYRVLSKHGHPTPGGTGPSWLSFIGHTRDSLWSVDLFRCESIVLQSYWVLVVMDQFTRRLVGIGVHRGAVTGADLCRMFNAAHSWSGHTATSQYRSRSPVRGASLDGEPADSGDRRN